MGRISKLIEDAQVSENRQSHFPRPGGGTTLSDFQQFTQSVEDTFFRTVEQYSRLDRSALRKKICEDLVRIAVDAFGAKCESEIESCITDVKEMQEKEVQRSFPLLQEFRPKTTLTQAPFDQFLPESQGPHLQRLEEARTDYLTALEAQRIITDAQISVAKALEELQKSGVINDEDLQTCPICEFQPEPTLNRGESIKSSRGASLENP